MLVNKMEDSFLLGIPEDALTQRLPPELACDYLQQVHLNGLLNENHIVFRHSWKKEEEETSRKRLTVSVLCYVVEGMSMSDVSITNEGHPDGLAHQSCGSRRGRTCLQGQ